MNQIELHPFLQQKDLLPLNNHHGILNQAWSPIGGITFYREGDGSGTLDDVTINATADRHGRTAAQVMLCWHVQHGRSAIPKSVTPRRIAENFDIFDFELTDEGLTRIDDLDLDIRRGPERRPSPSRTMAGQFPRRDRPRRHGLAVCDEPAGCVG